VHEVYQHAGKTTSRLLIVGVGGLDSEKGEKVDSSRGGSLFTNLATSENTYRIEGGSHQEGTPTASQIKEIIASMIRGRFLYPYRQTPEGCL